MQKSYNLVIFYIFYLKNKIKSYIYILAKVIEKKKILNILAKVLTVQVPNHELL